MTLSVGKLILVIAIIVAYVLLYSICKASGDAERRYSELAARKFTLDGGDASAV